MSGWMKHEWTSFVTDWLKFSLNKNWSWFCSFRSNNKDTGKYFLHAGKKRKVKPLSKWSVITVPSVWTVCRTEGSKTPLAKMVLVNLRFHIWGVSWCEAQLDNVWQGQQGEQVTNCVFRCFLLKWNKLFCTGVPGFSSDHSHWLKSLFCRRCSENGAL